MSTLSDWVKSARAHAQLTQSELAAQLGRTKANISHWELGKVSPPYLMMIKISEFTGYPLPGAAESKSGGVHDLAIGVPPDSIAGLVPLISWVQAGQWAEAVSVDPREVEEWLPCPVRHSPRTYALRVRGDSMTSPHGGRSYPEGSVIFVDPERRSPYNGQRVVALRIDSNEATFKTYKNEDGRQWLQPLNPTHEPLRDPFEVLGTVIGMWVQE